MPCGKSIFTVFAAVLTVCHATDNNIGLDLLETNSNFESDQGEQYILGFMPNNQADGRSPDIALYISTHDPNGASVKIDFPLLPNAAISFTLTQFETRQVRFSVGANGEIDFRNHLAQRAPTIRVVSERGARLDITGVNDQTRSVDTFKALPCKPDLSQNNFHASSYSYFAFTEGSILSGNLQSVLVISCGQDATTVRVESGDSYNLGRYDSQLIILSRSETGTVKRGTVITSSNGPIAVFSGHYCGQIGGVSACDHLVEQIPPDIVYGTRFFVLPFAARQSGDIIQVGSTVDDNTISITCNISTGGNTFQHTTTTRTIGSSQLMEYRTLSGQTEPGVNFCCVESSKPAIVMQYMLGFGSDRVTHNNIADFGDPAMTLVPPVEQYRNNYIVATPDDYLNSTTERFSSFLSWAIPTAFYNPGSSDSANFLVNNETFLPNITGSYFPFHCSNGEICGYGGTGGIVPGIHQISYRSSQSAGVYVSIYGMHREISYANPAGFDCEPIGAPRISTYNVQVSESAGIATIVFNRTGGNLATRSRIRASTVEIEEGGAVEGLDFTAQENLLFFFGPGSVDPRNLIRDNFRFRLMVPILDDTVPEPNEYFQVHFEIDDTLRNSAGYAFPSFIANVTIIDDDGIGGVTFSFEEDSYSVAENSGSAQLVIVKEGTVNRDVQLRLATMDGTASSLGDADFTATSRIITFPASETRVTVTVPITDDSVVEPNEIFTAIISEVADESDVEITQPRTEVTITNDDSVRFGFEQASYEFSESAGSAEVVIIKTGMIDQDIQLNFASADDTASSIGDADYTPVSRIITFPASETRVTVSVPITDDSVVEPNEIFTAMISEVADDPVVEITQPRTEVTITNDDSVSFGFEQTLYQFSENEGSAELVIVKTGMINRDIQLNFGTTDGTASSIGDADYTTTSRIITFPASEARVTVSVPITDDSVVESNEIFTAMISEVADESDVEITQPGTEITITNDDSVSFGFERDSYEFSENKGSAELVIIKNGMIDRDVQLNIATADDTASSIGNEDYTAISQVITFLAGQNRRTVSVPITEDDILEEDEVFQAIISEVSDDPDVELSRPLTTVQITNDDSEVRATVEFSPTEYTVVEGDSVEFMLVLSQPLSEAVSVEVTTVDNTADDNEDYSGVANLTITFDAGQVSRSFLVATMRDDVQEGDETFVALLTNPNMVDIGGNSEAIATIQDAITVQFDPATYAVTEGESALLTAVLSSPSQSDVTVLFSTRDVSAAAPDDYSAVSNMLITFTAGETSVRFPVQTAQDFLSETQESFEGFLSSPSGGASLGPNRVATITINDNNPLTVNLQPLSQDVAEGDNAFLNVVLSNQADREVMVTFNTQDGTADSSDYRPFSTVLTFAPGVTTMPVTITVLTDAVSELQESFRGVLSNPTSGLTIAAPQATINILAQPLFVTIFPDSYDVNEGEDAVILLVLSSEADREVTVEFNTRDGSAIGGADYDTTSTIVTFAPGQTTRTVTVPTNTDMISELQESFTGNLSNPSAGLMLTGEDATVNILAQTVEVGFVAATYQMFEGDSSDLMLTLSMATDRPVTVRYNTRDGTATAPGDYLSSAGTVTFPAGSRSQVITVTAIEDSFPEGLENFGVVLSSPSEGVTIGQDTADVQIVDDDATMINFVPTTYEVTEGGSIELTIQLSSPSGREITVDVTTSDGSALGTTDYTPQTTTLTFQPGQTEANVVVQTSDDEINELPEFFSAILNNPSSGAVLGPDSQATINIVDNDSLVVEFGEVSYSTNEGDMATLVVVTNRMADRDVEVDLSTFDGTATGPDYASVNSRLVIPSGENSETIQVQTVGDSLAEPTENFGARLANPSPGLTVGSASMANVEIIDQNDLTVSLESPEYMVPEPDEEVEVCLVLNIPASEQLSVLASAVNSNPTDAQDGLDYTSEQKEFIFAAGSTRACTNFDIIDDDISENLFETFSIEIDMIPPNNLNAQIGDTSSATVTIMDDDDLRVFIEQPSYRITESDGLLEVCLELNYETDQPFIADIQIRENDTQDAIDGVDFTSEGTSVIFQPGSQRECININIINDDIVEVPPEEIFIVEVTPEEPNSYRATAGPNSEVPVTIVDDDMVRVRIAQPEYSVNEGDGSVRVCVIRDGQTTDPITVVLNTRPGTATADIDYIPASSSLTIPPEGVMTCVDIQITDDPLAMEGDETFEVFITPPSGVPADETPSTVTIIDNDEILLNFDDPGISVNENIPGSTQNVCFTPDSPSAQDYTVQLAHRPTPPNPATAGLDYTVNMDDLTIIISAGEPVMYCVSVGIVDDNIPLEPLEAFTFNFTSLPEDVNRGSVPESRVTIFDDDRNVTLTPNSPTLSEEDDPVLFCVMLPAPPAAQEIRAEVVIQASSTDDFFPTSFTLIIPAGELLACMNITAVNDKIALEGNFVAPATITIVSPLSLSGTSFATTVTLVDNDALDVSFESSRYTVSEAGGSVITCLSLNCQAAVPVDVVISAKDGSALGGADYVARSQTVTFPAGSQNQCADFAIIDDTDEEFQESFTVCIDSATPPGVNTTSGNSTTTVVIEDDDMVALRLTQDDYRVVEDMGPVEVCVERVGQTFQNITLLLVTEETASVEAENGQDFVSGFFVVTIQPSQTQACAEIPITNDNLALEGEERFQVSVPSAGLSSTITIVDDDVANVFFTTPEVVVREDAVTGQVCVNSNTISARPYTVTLSHAGSGTNQANDADYTVNMGDLTVSFPAGAPVEQCVPFMPVDDDLAREGNETFSFTINPSSDINIGSPDMAEVTIIENDFNVVVNFVSENVQVNEDNGTVTVCVMRDRLTEGPLTVPIAITQGSADSQDFRETVTDVTFAPSSSMACAEIPIVDDTEQEVTENFVVGFGMSPDFQPGPRAQSNVTIIDNDEPGCVLQDSYVVRPFNSSQGYTYRGSCEIVAIQSCNDTERDFSVRVDYITATSDLGAVGVHKDEYIWVSREDGEFVSTARNERVEADGSIFYPFNDVRVTRNTTANRTIISVGDGIGVTIVHNYGDGGSISFSVASGSSLLETCGLCGTQSGQLIDLNGFIATTPAERLRVVETYRTQARYQSLRPIRTECTRLCNDTVIGDPLFTVPYLPPPGEPRRSLCFEVHGRPDTHFNLVSDTCVSVNALYTGVSTVDGPLNIISSIGVRAQDSLGNCQNIRVDLDQCGVSVGMNGALTSLGAADYSQDGISIRRRMTDRVRVSVPNCENVPLSMWVICERGNPVDMIRFQISRGKNLRSTSHGLLAQFWNVMVNVQRFTPPPGSSMEHDADKLYNVTVQAADDPNDQDHSPMPPYRHFLGDLFPRTWDNTREECLYVGNGQGGPTAEFFELFTDSVIEGRYTDYIVDSIFATDFVYDRIEGNCAV